MTAETRVLLCYPEKLLRAGLRSVLDSVSDVRVVGEAEDGYDALSKARGLRPDVALIDERLSGLDGVQVTARLRDDARTGSIRSIMLTEQPDVMFHAIKAGARGFLLRSSDQDELVRAIRAIAGGEAFFAPQVASRFLQWFETSQRHQVTTSVAELTERELEVLTLVAEGLSTTEVADKLYVSKSTVKFHVSNLLTKLGLRDRLQLAVYAHRAGVV
jgi:DNA-binding NarL/FixJ family response regulator